MAVTADMDAAGKKINPASMTGSQAHHPWLFFYSLKDGWKGENIYLLKKECLLMCSGDQDFQKPVQFIKGVVIDLKSSALV